MIASSENIGAPEGAINVGASPSGLSPRGSVARGGGHTSALGLSGVVADPRWHVEKHIRRSGGSLDCRCSKVMAVRRLSLFVHDRHFAKHDTCVGVWRWRCGVINRIRAMLMTEAPLADMPFVQCEDEVDCCRRLRDVMSRVVGGEQPDGVDLSLWLFNKPNTKVHLVHFGRLRSCVL